MLEMQRVSVFSLALIALIPMGTVDARQAEDPAVETLHNATTVFQEIMNNPDKAIPHEILKQARCVVIVPHQSEGGTFFGRARLRGVFSCRTGKEWGAPGFITLRPVQIGSEKSDYVLLLMDKLSNEALSSGKFKLGADARVAAGPLGRQASAGTDWSMSSQVLAYSRSRGLFAGADLTGGEVEYDSAFTEALYGKKVKIRSVLSSQVSPPGGAQELLKALSNGGYRSAAKDGGTDSLTEDGESHIPSFPWPPPAASTEEVIPSAMLEKDAILKSLGDLDAKLVSALRSNGYVERSYYAVPDGFALVTRLEQIGPDGTPKTPPGRWSLNSPSATVFTLRDYLRALFTADPGYYRVIVFIISDVPFSQAPRQTTYEETIIWLKGGLNVLPVEIASKPYGKTIASTVLIYEFEKDQGHDPKLNQPGRLDAHMHLNKSGIWDSLQGRP
jgi:lipid-binding SYLF domain-containing protein